MIRPWVAPLLSLMATLGAAPPYDDAKRGSSSLCFSVLSHESTSASHQILLQAKDLVSEVATKMPSVRYVLNRMPSV